MDGAATTGLMATMATMERGLLRLNPLPNLPLQLTLTLTPTLGTVIMAMATVAMDGAATTGLMATMATMERGLLMLNLLPNLPQQLTLMLTPTLGMVIMATMERGLLMLNPLPNLPQQLTLTPTLGTVIM